MLTLYLRKFHSQKCTQSFFKISFERSVLSKFLIPFDLHDVQWQSVSQLIYLSCKQSISLLPDNFLWLQQLLFCEKQWKITLWSPFPPSQRFYRPLSFLPSNISFRSEECFSTYSILMPNSFYAFNYLSPFFFLFFFLQFFCPFKERKKTARPSNQRAVECICLLLLPSTASWLAVSTPSAHISVGLTMLFPKSFFPAITNFEAIILPGFLFLGSCE